MIRLPEWNLLPDIGLYMDQIMTLMDRVFTVRLPKGELTKPMINNYVRAGLLPRPCGKKYDREHLAMILMIYVLKQSLNMDGVSAMLKMLCQNGTEEGYERFRECLEELNIAITEGTVDMDRSGSSMEKHTLCLGLMAVLCTVQTYRLLNSREEAG